MQVTCIHTHLHNIYIYLYLCMQTHLLYTFATVYTCAHMYRIQGGGREEKIETRLQ